MLGKLQVWLVGEFIRLNEKYIFNRRLLKFYENNLEKKINLVLDVGANSGQSIDLFFELNPDCKIIAFEPNPRLAQNLKQKFLNNSNVQSFQLGISDSNGPKTFYENIFDATSTLEELEMNSKYLKKKSRILGVKPENIIVNSYPVEVTTLSSFINSHCTESIDILKIDTEGHEYACLVGLFANKLKQHIEFIQLEIHYDDMYINGKSLNELTELLSKNGYQLEGKIKHGFGEFEDVVFRRRKG